MHLKSLPFLLLLFWSAPLSLLRAQDTTEQTNAAIMEEGKRMYFSEMASWYGTDIFLERYPEQRERIGGYFSYSSEGMHHCVFFSRDATPAVLATISFDSTFELNKARVDGSSRAFTPHEKQLHLLRSKAMADVQSDTLYKSYNNTSLNLIPIVHNGQGKVYILTGPKVDGVVVFGNDYLVTFDNNHEIIGRRALHRNIIPVAYGNEKQATATGTIHSHLAETGDFMTPTDVCTLLLYARRAGWQQHYVMSPHYVSIWSIDKPFILSLTREAWERIYQDQEKRRKK